MNIQRQIAKILMLSILLFPACGSSETKENAKTEDEKIYLTFYGLFDNEEIYQPMIEDFESEHENIKISYKKFTDPNDYLNLIVSEMAEGEGPDIFMMHNSWFPEHYKKLVPAPTNIINKDIFKALFADIASQDLVFQDENGEEQIWGLPIYIDTLALFYNKAQIQDALGKSTPGKTWTEIANEVQQINIPDQSYARFQRAAIAMGRPDNILRAFDIIIMLILQYEVSFYNEDYTEVTLANDPNATSALELFASFALSSQQNYSWNRYLADADSPEKEMETFAKGQVSMILGYSYAYKEIENLITTLQKEGEVTIDINDVAIQEAPQVYNPEIEPEKVVSYASYFVPAVSRTTLHPQETWEFLAFLANEENLSFYNEKTHKPSPLKSTIKDQSKDSIYGVFASQIETAKSIPIANASKYQQIFMTGIDEILDTSKSTDVVQSITKELQQLIPSEGVKPNYASAE